MKNKIIVDQPQPTDQEIDKYRDFDKVLKMHAAGPSSAFLKVVKPWMAVAVAGVVGIVVAVLIMDPSDKPDEIITQTKEEQPFINPPVVEYNPDYEYFLVSVARDTTLHTSGGTEIFVPAGSLVNGKGQAVTGEVEFRYREFMNPYEIFTSGIPMTYMVNGEEMVFESAGMLDLRAYQQGESLAIADNRQLDIKFVSLDTSSRFRLYYLDEAGREWKDKGTTGRYEPESREIATTRQAIINAPPVDVPDMNAPVVPVKASSDGYIFPLEYDKRKFPELGMYENVLFEIRDKAGFSPKYFSVIWTKMELDHMNEKGHYMLSLHKSDTTLNYEVIPVFDADDYAYAKDQYDKENEKLRKKIEVARADKLKAERNRTVSYGEVDMENPYSVSMRLISINNLGIWNCDQPINRQVLDEKIEPMIVDQNGRKVKYNTLYVVNKRLNAVFTFYPNQTVRISGYSENVVWVITNDGKIGIIEPKSIEKEKLKKHMTCPAYVYTDNAGGMIELEQLLI